MKLLNNLVDKIFTKYFVNFKYRNEKAWINGFGRTKSIFIHIPKNAGTSISLALYDEDPHHFKLSHYSFLNKATYDSYFKFSIVRNPYERIYSSYKYSFSQKLKHETTSVAFVTEFLTFESFIKKWLNIKNIDSHYFFSTQTSYLQLAQNKGGVDFIARFENLAEDFRFISDKLGTHCTLEKLNQSNYNMKTIIFDQDIADIVYEVYKEDFLNYNYAKDSWKNIIR
jgi:hypothetical protein